MESVTKNNRRKVQVRNYWAYHNRRKTPQPKGGYDFTCFCGKSVEYCPECENSVEQNSSILEDSDMLE